MKKIILPGMALLLLSCFPARADSSMHAVYGEEKEVVVEKPYRGYVGAPDYPSEHYDYHTDRHNDYWARHDEAVRQQAGHDSRKQDHQ